MCVKFEGMTGRLKAELPAVTEQCPLNNNHFTPPKHFFIHYPFLHQLLSAHSSAQLAEAGGYYFPVGPSHITLLNMPLYNLRHFNNNQNVLCHIFSPSFDFAQLREGHSQRPHISGRNQVWRIHNYLPLIHAAQSEGLRTNPLSCLDRLDI